MDDIFRTGGGMEERRIKDMSRKRIGFIHNAGLWWDKAGGKKKGAVLAAVAVVILAAVAVIWQGICRRESAPALSEHMLSVTAAPTPARSTSPPKPTPRPEEGIYSFLQGPKSWGSRLQWSGEWGVSYYDGGSFGGFGCGLCCIANIYSSLTKYQCTPVDAYKYAKKHTGYGGGGAIDWGYMRQSLSGMGFRCQVARKPGSYQTFQRQIKKSQAAVVLVSSNNSTCYWKATPGHYVTIFLYNEKTDKVFLADSGDPAHNRHWVPLKKIYASLKTSSPWQYLSVEGYDKDRDQWKHRSARGNWVK